MSSVLTPAWFSGLAPAWFSSLVAWVLSGLASMLEFSSELTGAAKEIPAKKRQRIVVYLMMNSEYTILDGLKARVTGS